MASRNVVTNIDLVQNNDASVPDSGFIRIKAKPDGYIYIIDGLGNEVKIQNTTPATSIPTTMQLDFTIPNNQQILFKQRITLGSHSIIIGLDASLIGV